MEWVAANHVGDWASILGVVISVVGFAITIVNVVRSRRVAETVRKEIRLLDVVAEFSSAIAIVDEIKRLHRAAASWPIVLDRYSALKRLLLTLKNTGPLTERERVGLQTAIQTLSEVEAEVENALPNPDSLNVPTLNAIMSKQADQLHEILSGLRDRTR